MFRTISTVLAGLLCIAVAGIMGIVTAPTPTVADSTVQVEDTDSDITLEEDGEIGEPLVVDNPDKSDVEWPDEEEPVDPDVPTQAEIDNGDVTSEVHEGNWTDEHYDVEPEPGCE